MNDIIKKIEDEQLKENVGNFRVGDTVRVYAKIKEGNGGARETFTVRKLSNGVGVEKTWPLHSPMIDHVDVIRNGKVRRARLTYLRDRIGKAAKVKEARR